MKDNRLIQTIFCILAVILVTSVFLTGCENTCPNISDKAPDFTLQTMDNKNVSLRDFKGEKVLLNFWTTWCIYCKLEAPFIEAVYKKYMNEGKVILTIDVNENPDLVSEHMRKYNLTFPVLLDKQGKITRQFCISAYPITLFINPEGIIKARKIGAFQSAKEIDIMMDSF